MEAVMVNLADLPWRPMDSVPSGQAIMVFNSGVARKSFFGQNKSDDKGWLTLAEFDKLVNREKTGI